MTPHLIALASLAVAAIALAVFAAAHWLSALDEAQRNLCRRMGVGR